MKDYFSSLLLCYSCTIYFRIKYFFIIDRSRCHFVNISSYCDWRIYSEFLIIISIISFCFLTKFSPLSKSLLCQKFQILMTMILIIKFNYRSIFSTGSDKLFQIFSFFNNCSILVAFGCIFLAYKRLNLRCTKMFSGLWLWLVRGFSRL